MKTWHIIGILVVIVLALWYVFGQQAPADMGSSALEQASALSSGDTTADISADLNGALDTSAALDADESASAAAAAGL